MVKSFLALFALSALAWPAAAAIAPPAGISSSITASADEEPAFTLRGEGVQIFECKPLASDPDRFAWVFTGPEATLYDSGRAVGRHGADLMWEATGDRSSVTGTIRSRQDGGANNLPWLLLRAQPSGETGTFAKVTSIQRVNTAGGVAPAAGCDAAHAGAEARVAFTADYYFYKRRG